MKSTLILCTPRSGAAWLIALLRRLGLPATHEVLFRAEGPRPNVMPPDWIEASWCAVPFARDLRVDQRIMLIRNPLHVVRSIMRIELFDRPPDPFVDLAKLYTPGWQDNPPLVNACMMVAEWYRISREARINRTVHLESEGEMLDLCEWLGADRRLAKRQYGNMPDRMNQRGDSSSDTISWDDIEAASPQLIVIAKQGGYL